MKETEKGYSIIGSAIGFTDSTMVYLDTLSGSSFRSLDSTYVIGEKFIFKGAFKTKATRIAIRTQDIKNTCQFWLENSTIYLDAEKGSFKDAIIKGSETQDDENKLNAAINSSKNKNDIREQYLKFISSHPNSIISPLILYLYAPGIGKETTGVLYDKLSEEVKNSVYGKMVADFISLSRKLKVGDKYADFTLQNSMGENMSVSDFKGKIVLLEFWGSWCGPCRQENPELIRIYDKFHKKGFEILGVAAESNREKWLEAIKKDKLPWANVTDIINFNNMAVMIYNVYRFPTNYLIDRTGTIIEKDISGEKLEAKLRAIL